MYVCTVYNIVVPYELYKLNDWGKVMKLHNSNNYYYSLLRQNAAKQYKRNLMELHVFQYELLILEDKPTLTTRQ